MPKPAARKSKPKPAPDLSHIAAGLRPLAVPLARLAPDPANARTHPEKNLDAIRGSLAAYGQVKPVVARAGSGVVIAGNGTLAAARDLGWTHLAAVFVEMSDARAAGYAVADNRTADLAGWDKAALDALLRECDTGGDERLDAMLADLAAEVGVAADAAEPGGGGDDFDATPEAEGPTRTLPGELWVIGGRHRLLVGDCTVPENVARLMGDDSAEMVWTDPPYGVSIGDKNKYLNSIARSDRVEENLRNDSLDEAGISAMLSAAFDNAARHCAPGAAWYVAAPPGPLHLLFADAMKDRGILRQMLIWVKNNATFSPMGVSYHWRHEPVFYGWLPNGGHRFHGDRKQDTVWEVDRPQASADHPTMKPIALVGRAVGHSSRPGQLVYDPFLGSGTTLVAAHRLGRVCYGCEIEPRYADVILKRAEAEGMTCERAEPGL